MNKKYLILIILAVSSLLSCSKRTEGGNGDNNQGTAEVELNLEKSSPAKKAEPSGENLPNRETPALPGRTPSIPEAQQAHLNFFLSGRTELLSLQQKKTIIAEGFSIGELYIRSNGTVAEREVIEITSLFLESLGGEQIYLNAIHPDNKMEIEDFCRYFVAGKIAVDTFILGKPRLYGDQADLEVLLRPENRIAYVYLGKNNDKWLVTGLEIDLNKAPGDETVEKWAPSVRISPMGY